MSRTITPTGDCSSDQSPLGVRRKETEDPYDGLEFIDKLAPGYGFDFSEPGHGSSSRWLRMGCVQFVAIMLLLLRHVRNRFGRLPFSFHSLFRVSATIAAAGVVARVQNLVYAYIFFNLSMA